MDIFAPNGQQLTSTMYWLILTVSGSRVSNLLALLAARTTEWLSRFGRRYRENRGTQR